jgi:upstream activation factor subunit UAF30
MQEMKLSEELADVVGIRRAPRHEVVKRMWRYIKENNLQWPKNKQWIKCDDKLFKLIGQKKFRGFGMTKYLKDHMN